MQLMPPTARWTADRADVRWERNSFDPALNVRLGCEYLGHLIATFKGRLDLALTAYNRGPSATKHIVRRHGRLPAEIHDFYAGKVLAKYAEYQSLYGHLGG